MTEPRDPQARAYYDDLARRCADQPWVTIVPMGREVGNVELNVFQSAADVVMQRGLRKGYGMWVSDALWKRRAVVTGGAPGLREQVVNGETGIVAESPAEFEDAVVKLLDDRPLAERLGDGGRRLVKDKFLITRYLRDYLNVLNELHGSA
jgi:trehalose synthase